MTPQQITEALEKAIADIQMAREKLYDIGSNTALIHVTKARVRLSQIETEMIGKL